MNDAATGCCDMRNTLACCCTEGAERATTGIEICGHLCLQDGGNGLYLVEQLLGREFYVIIDGNSVILPCSGMTTDLGSIPRLVQTIVPKDKWNAGFIPHDACYFYRYVLRPKTGVVGCNERKYLASAAHIEDENERLHILGPAFDLLPIRSRGICDTWLDRIIAHKSGGDAKFDRAMIRSGLWAGSWVPWYFGKYAKRMENLQKHPLFLNNMTVLEAIG